MSKPEGMARSFVNFCAAYMPAHHEQPYKWFQQNARDYDKVDWKTSEMLAKEYHSHLRQCFMNCSTIALHEKDLRYVEGFATSILPMPHAWLINSADIVIDPTWSLLKKKDPKPDYVGVVIPADFALVHHTGPSMADPSWMAYYANIVVQPKIA